MQEACKGGKRKKRMSEEKGRRRRKRRRVAGLSGKMRIELKIMERRGMSWVE